MPGEPLFLPSVTDKGTLESVRFLATILNSYNGGSQQRKTERIENIKISIDKPPFS